MIWFLAAVLVIALYVAFLMLSHSVTKISDLEFQVDLLNSRTSNLADDITALEEKLSLNKTS